jgi:hypothetical protein
MIFPVPSQRSTKGASIIHVDPGLKILNLLRPLGRWAWGKFAQQPGWRAFVSWQAYYHAYLGTDAGHALIQHTGPLVGDAARQIEVINGMAAGRGPAVVWAPPGCGKSRFALELAQRIEKGGHRWQVVFVQHDESVVREELHQLTQLKRLVFVVDDAQECPELVKLLAAACAQATSSAPLHLVCMTRSTGRAQVTQAINSVFPPGTIQEIGLGRPSQQLVRALIDQLLPKSSPLHRDTIERFVRQSYFGAVLVCTLLRREGRLPQSFQRQDLRDRVCREPLRDAVQGVCSIEMALRALAVYAALSPVAKADVEVRELAAQLSALAPANVDILIERVVMAGLFQEYGRARLRPIPDLLGDLILEEACLNAQGQPTPYGTQLLERLFEVDSVTTVRNCADIGQLFGTAEDVDLVSKLILERARRVPPDSKWDVMQLLRTCVPLSVRRPATVLELAAILETRGILRRRPPAAELYGIDSIEMDTCALLMRAGEVDPIAVPVALRLGGDLHAAASGDARSLKQVFELLEAYCKFEIGRDLAHAQAVVNTLRAWVSESDSQTAALAVSLSGQFLTLEVKGQREAGLSMTFIRSGLRPAPEVWAVRDVAVDTLVRGMAHADIDVQFAAMGALDHYASGQLSPEQVPLDAWRPQLTREIEVLSAAITQRVKATKSSSLCAIAEQRGWRWWTNELELLQHAGITILESVPDTDDYRLWKSLHAHQLPARTVVPKDDFRDVQTRLRYLQASGALREEEVAARASELFDALDSRYPDVAAWRTLWLSVFEQAPRMPLDYKAGVVVEEFARRHPDAAWSFVNDTDADGPIFALLPFLLVELGKLDRTRRSRAAERVRAGTRLEEAWLRALWGVQEPNEAERALLGRGLVSTDPDTVHRAAAALLSASHGERMGAFRAVFAAIAQRPADSALWELVIERFVHWAERVLPPRPVEPDQGMVAVAADLIELLKTQSSSLRWGFQTHTRQLANALAILAVVQPRQLQDWMRQAWGQAQDHSGGWTDESPLSVSRLSEMMRSIADSAVAAQWIEGFVDWMKREPQQLGGFGALGLAELCSLDDPRIGELAGEIGSHPTDASLKAFAAFVHHQKADEAFAPKALALLEIWTRFPDTYARIEEAVLHALVNPAGGRSSGRASPPHVRALEAVEARRARGTASGLLLASLERAEREIREAMANDTARDEEYAEAD